jgi:hypothetical protein
MSQFLKSTFYLACLAIWVNPVICQTLTNVNMESHLTLNVQLHNMAHARSEVVAEAEKEAARIFDAAGISIIWDECPCSQVLSPNSVMLRIIPRLFGSARTISRQENLGYAVVGAEGGVLATVFYDRVEAMTNGGNPSRVLGYAMAHEIGHLLLGQSSHSSEGLMRANWSRKDLKPVHCDQMHFTPEQAEHMRTGLGSEQKESLQSYIPS